ncbi:4329_t:CDS:1, partial [Racocetra fulgida]
NQKSSKEPSKATKNAGSTKNPERNTKKLLEEPLKAAKKKCKSPRIQKRHLERTAKNIQNSSKNARNTENLERNIKKSAEVPQKNAK